MAEDRDQLPTKPAGRARTTDVDAFLRKVAVTPVTTRPGERGRLIFAMDATASREPSWDRACHIQGEMFRETAALGGLEIQLVFYRGFGECKASGWLTRSDELLRRMTGVFCLGGRTQIEKVLKRAVAETKDKRVNALVFVGDAMEEDVDLLCHLAGQLGMLGVPVFVFHEGDDAIARRTFQQIARLSNGAYCRFDVSSAQQLRDLLGAVAVFAAGGRKALDDYGRKKGGVVLQITHQVAGNK
jgi:hypothetical protein